MDMVEAVKLALANWSDFSGRSRRSDFWWCALAYILAYLALDFIFWNVLWHLDGFGLVMYYLSLIVISVPQISLSVRRLHDGGYSGWLILLGIIPLIGLVLLYFYVQDSQEGENQYGPNPKGIGNNVELAEGEPSED